MRTKYDKDILHIIDHLIKVVNLPDFIEKETGSTLSWGRSKTAGKCHCPMPSHRDSNASFNVNFMYSEVWVYHCFGCGVKGNIIHFCMDYFGCRNKHEAVVFLCEKLDIKNTEELILHGLKNVTKRVDTQRVMENSNIMVSNQCRMLLRKDYKKNAKWVSQAYKRLDNALDSEDSSAIEQIGYEAFERMK